MELEKRLERLERAITGVWVGFAAGLVVAGLACLLSLVAIFYRPVPVPVEAAAERAAAPDKPSRLEELERLEALKAKGAITQQEFDAEKQRLLAAAPPPAKPTSPAAGKAFDVDELDKLLRNAQALYNKNTITGAEYQAKKQQYLQLKVTVGDLTKDMDKVQKLYNESILSGSEYQALKQQVLAADPALGKK